MARNIAAILVGIRQPDCNSRFDCVGSVLLVEGDVGSIEVYEEIPSAQCPRFRFPRCNDLRVRERFGLEAGGGVVFSSAAMAKWKWDSPGLKWDMPGLKWDGEMPERKHQMQEDNRISAEMPDADVTAVLDAIALIRSKMPWLVSISQQDRQEMAKLGEKSFGFAEKCRNYMASNPQFMPGFVQKAEVDKDAELLVQLMRFAGEIETLADAVGDSTMVVGGEYWMACLAYYQSVREAARRKIAGAETIYNDLKTRFPGGKQPPQNPTPPPTP